jgi:acetyltransferase-like isoleucine patch superfamily enzyme
MRRALRVGWAALSAFLVESALIALAAFPSFHLLEWLARSTAGPARPVVLLCAVGPAYVLFAVWFMILSPLAMRFLGWRTPVDARLRIAYMDWPLLDWARYLASAHLVRLLTGGVLRATPLWTMYLRLNGARIGRGVYVNSLEVMDHNLLELEDGVVIGAGAHLSGHTVEAGFVKTGMVHLGRNVTIGVGSVVGIDVRVGAGAQVGALSLVPKHSNLAEGAVYAGIPVQRIDAGAHRDHRLAYPSI